MKFMYFSCLFTLSIAAVISCKQKTPGAEHTTAAPIKYTEKELDSGWIYKVVIPENYRIQKEGAIDYFVYSLVAPDSAINNFGTAEIHFSKNMYTTLQRPNLVPLKDSLITGKVLNTSVVWKVFQYDKTVSAETILAGEGIGFKTTSTNYPGLDSLIRIVSSLRKTN